MLKQFLRKQRKILRGAHRTFVRGERTAYDSSSWFDNQFFTRGMSDRQTIAPDQNPLVAAYHYNSVENLILRHLLNRRRDATPSTVCDLGSGSGHWIDFYRSLGVSRCLGIDVSSKSVDFLKAKYAGQDDVAIHHGRIRDVLASLDARFDLVNAIGVMFHIVDDGEWEETLRQAGRVLTPRGLFVVGGHFGLLDGVNVQFDADNTVNKRLRSLSRWKRSLRRAGFAGTTLYRNTAYLHVFDALPENNVLVAEKQG
jgi:SAM-dependent methyltransferase